MTDRNDDWETPNADDERPDEDSRDPEHKLQGDERMYTGEPVETDEGTYRPQQMNVGFENMEGSGEFPDPHALPKPGSVGEAERTAWNADDR
jgi:hypothetical protein